jgi:hypothetical protein
MSRLTSVLAVSVAFLATITATTPAISNDTATIPDHFFSQWTISKNCTELDKPGHAQPQQVYRIARASQDAATGTYLFEAVTANGLPWAAGWQGTRLQYRAGVRLAQAPAEFQCTPGQSASNAFLAISNYVQTAEPYYPYEHWYALITIDGSPHHMMIFPTTTKGVSNAVIMLQSAGGDAVLLDHDGTIHSDNF